MGEPDFYLTQGSTLEVLNEREQEAVAMYRGGQGWGLGP